jgi:hypothetical protein
MQNDIEGRTEKPPDQALKKAFLPIRWEAYVRDEAFKSIIQ